MAGRALKAAQPASAEALPSKSEEFTAVAELEPGTETMPEMAADGPGLRN